MFGQTESSSVNLNSGSKKPPPPGQDIGPIYEFWLVYAGIVLPTLAILAETQYHVCAKFFFDPFPSTAHVLLFAAIPFANLTAWLSLQQKVRSQYGLALFANGIAGGVALLYTLMFIPVMPSACALIWCLGFGLLGLAPLFALTALLPAGGKLSKVAEKHGTFFHPDHAKNAGHLLILCMVLALELPSTVTRVAMDLASKRDSRELGLKILRTVGSQEVMLRACYERSGRATDVLGSLYEVSHPTNVEVMRNLFYKVTGRTFNSFPIPEAARATMSHAGLLSYDGMDLGAQDEFDLDPDIAGEMVSGVSRGLSVSESKIEAQIDSDACVSQLDWYLGFNNVSKFDREVRTRIKLPQGGVVNKASLIVNGKEYECSITTKQEAREIYQEAVESKRNPLLVSLSGEDTVLVQCFPVPPGKGLKLHLGIVAPLLLGKDNQAVLSMPQFEERNFQITVPYSVSMTANHEMKAPWEQMKLEHLSANKFQLSGEIDPGQLAANGGILTVARHPYDSKRRSLAEEETYWTEVESKQVWQPSRAYSDYDHGTSSIIEKLTSTKLKQPGALFVVIDLSTSMSEHFKAITESLHKLPPNMQVSLACVSDKGVTYLTGTNPLQDGNIVLGASLVDSKPATLAPVLKRLSEQNCEGGQMDGPALKVALWSAAAVPNSHVLWLHGAQPLNTKETQDIKSTLETSRENLLYDMQLSTGPNQFLDGINNESVRKVSRYGDCVNDLSLLFEQWQQPGLLHAFEYEVCTPGVPNSEALNSEAHNAEALNSEAHNAEALNSEAHNSEEPNSEAPKLGARSVRYPSLAALTKGPQRCTLASSRHVVSPGKETLKQLAQLWANKRIKSLLKGNYQYDAITLAASNHLVTPVSSAVLADTVPDLDRMSSPAVPEQNSLADNEILQAIKNLITDVYNLNPIQFQRFDRPLCAAPQITEIEFVQPETPQHRSCVPRRVYHASHAPAPVTELECNEGYGDPDPGNAVAEGYGYIGGDIGNADGNDPRSGSGEGSGGGGGSGGGAGGADGSGICTDAFPTDKKEFASLMNKDFSGGVVNAHVLKQKAPYPRSDINKGSLATNYTTELKKVGERTSTASTVSDTMPSRGGRHATYDELARAIRQNGTSGKCEVACKRVVDYSDSDEFEAGSSGSEGIVVSYDKCGIGFLFILAGMFCFLFSIVYKLVSAKLDNK